MNLRRLSNDQLHSSTHALAEKERLTTIEVLWHLRENERRMLYASMGYRDLKEYCVKELNYSEGSAWRRISAMKLLVDIPEVEAKIQNGTLNLSQIAMARSHFREVKATREQRQETLLALESQTKAATQRILAERKPEPVMPKPEISEKPIKGNRVEVTFVIDRELQNDLEEINILLGKPHSKLELLKLMAKEMLQRLRREKCNAQPPRSKAAAKSRYVAKQTVREIKLRDQHRCQYKDTNSGNQCEARFHLQLEHIQPFAKGGKTESKNLQLLCPTHNRLKAVQQFGREKMKIYLPILRDQM